MTAHPRGRGGAATLAASQVDATRRIPAGAGEPRRLLD